MKARHHLLQGLRSTPSILAAFVAAIPAEKLDLRRGDGFWTIAEHVSHLAQVQPMLLTRIDRFIGEDHPVFTPYIPGADEKAPETPPRMEMAVAMDRFAAVRSDQVARLAAVVDEEEIWQRSATHPEYTRYTLSILTRHLLMHDHWHMYRMEELWLTRDAYLTRLA
ncbi:MAG: DinB family protein [Desulfosarcinaceae bacterium]|nr:DinB family protein [Desulfosarcinaceae bacterium]